MTLSSLSILFLALSIFCAVPLASAGANGEDVTPPPHPNKYHQKGYEDIHIDEP